MHAAAAATVTAHRHCHSRCRCGLQANHTGGSMHAAITSAKSPPPPLSPNYRTGGSTHITIAAAQPPPPPLRRHELLLTPIFMARKPCPKSALGASRREPEVGCGRREPPARRCVIRNVRPDVAAPAPVYEIWLRIR